MQIAELYLYYYLFAGKAKQCIEMGACYDHLEYSHSHITAEIIVSCPIRIYKFELALCALMVESKTLIDEFNEL